MKYIHLFRYVPVISLLVSSSIPLSPAQAQQTDNEQVQSDWQKLKQANSRIRASHVVWQRVQHLNPVSNVDPDKAAASALSAALDQGMTKEEAQQRADAQRRDAVRSQQGREINSVLNFTRVGKSVLCRIENPDPNYRNESIEFSNGIDSLYAQTQVKGKKVSKDGNLVRQPDEILSHSAWGYQVARLLVGLPLDEDFAATNPALTPKNASLKTLTNGELTIERDARIEGNVSQDPDSVTFDKDKLYPLSADTFDILTTLDGNKFSMRKNDLQTRVVASAYKEYPGGIWFPSKVTRTTPTSTTEFSLVVAKFNDQVDPQDLRLPPDLRVADARFGTGDNLAIYNVKDGKLPSDEQVRALLQMDAQASQAKLKDNQNVEAKPTKLASSPFTSIAGLALIMLSGLVLVKSKPKSSDLE